MKREQSLVQALHGSRHRPHMNILRIASAVIAAETLVFGAHTFEAIISGSPTAGRLAIDLSAAASLTAASKTLTFAGNVEAGDTVTIGGTTYTFKASLTASTTANEVLIGVDLTASRNNLVAAINKGTGGGTLYGSDTVANASASASASSTDALVATASTKGTVGNSIAIAEASATLSWAGAATVLSGGADTSASDFTTAATAAINAAGVKLLAQRISANEILVIDRSKPTNAVACTETLAGANNAWAAATSYGGEGALEEVPALAMVKRSPNATEVTLETMHFFFSFVPASVIVQVRTSAGAIKAIDAVTTISANRVTITSSGSTDLAATDTVTVLASA